MMTATGTIVIQNAGEERRSPAFSKVPFIAAKRRCCCIDKLGEF